MPEIDCLSSTTNAKLRLDSISFSEIPGQSKLFLEYQSDPLSLRKYYPSAVAAHTSIAERTSEVLEAYATDRDSLCDILAEQNRGFGAAEATLENIDLLRKSGTVAVLTGQQAGLFTGPLYTVYKAMSAIRMTECLRNRGIDAVPVFWAATEDHDFEEISTAYMLGRNGDEVEFRLATPEGVTGTSVGSIVIPDPFERELHDGIDELQQGDFLPELRDALGDIWKPGHTIGEAFCADIQRLFKDRGLIVVDPLDLRVKKLAAPIYSRAVERSETLVNALVDRTKELETSGYHAQVLVTPDYFPLFYHTDDGARSSLRRRGDSYHVAGSRTEFTIAQLAELAASEPQRFSPGVMLRSVVQDYLFPTVCYFGGGAEIAYFAQNSEVYRLLDRPVTTILHRQSFTVVGPKASRVLDKFELGLSDLFAGYEALLPRIVDRFVNPTTARLFADAEENINLELNRLDQELSRIDPTLAANLATRRRKILYHIAALQKKFRRVQVERDETVNRQLRLLFTELLPHGQLQERRLNIGSFTALYGPTFVDTVYDSIDLDDRGHRILYLS
jgi:bacillithiol biosynthesis cysteine-adding enzyme BshC